jgi:hypothetical protein
MNDKNKELITKMKEGKTVVLNKRKEAGQQAAIAYAKEQGIYVPVHRPFKWKNPFKIDESRPEESRAEACAQFAAYLQGKPELMQSIKELKGKALVCYCAPLQCHADHLAELADQAEK